eukprot:4281915-Amphidinium_carterae.1
MASQSAACGACPHEHLCSPSTLLLALVALASQDCRSCWAHGELVLQSVALVCKSCGEDKRQGPDFVL